MNRETRRKLIHGNYGHKPKRSRRNRLKTRKKRTNGGKK